MIMIKYFHLFIFLVSINMIGCSGGSKDLDVVLKKDNLCFFTNDKKSNYYDSNKDLLIYMNRAERKEEITSTFEKNYKNFPLPIDEVNCLSIPLSSFEQNIVYTIVLDIKPTYSSNLCLKRINNELIVKKLKAGEVSCPKD